MQRSLPEATLTMDGRYGLITRHLNERLSPWSISMAAGSTQDLATLVLSLCRILLDTLSAGGLPRGLSLKVQE